MDHSRITAALRDLCLALELPDSIRFEVAMSTRAYAEALGALVSALIIDATMTGKPMWASRPPSSSVSEPDGRG